MSTANKLLRQFYGLERPNQEQEARDIDSPHFQAQAFFEESVKKDSLPQLLARENTLISDIRSFDNDLQTLVYDNYSKFLGATDTVRSLRQNITALSGEMGDLKANLGKVAQRSDAIGSDLEPNRQKIQRLVGISRLLGRVEFISKLPKQLRACLMAKKYGVAVDLWTKVEGILSTQQHFPSFKRIHEECKEIMEEMRMTIRGQMLNMDVSVSDSIDCAVLLVKLKTPLATVCSQLAHHWFLVIDNSLEYKDIPEEPFSALSMLKDAAINDASLFVRLYREKLSDTESNAAEKNKMEGIVSDFMNSTFERIAQFLPVKSLFGLDCKSIGSYMSSFVDTMSDMASQQQISKHLHKILQQYTEAKTMRVYDQLAASMTGKSGMELFQHVTTHFFEACSGLISDFKVLAMMNHQECSHFLIQQISLMFEKIFQFFRTSDPQNALVYSVIACIFSEKDIPQIFEELSNLEQDSPLESLQERIFVDCKNVIHVCLKRFVAFQREVVDRIVFSLMNGTRWSSMREAPTTASREIRELIDHIDKLSQEVNGLLALTKTHDITESDSSSWQRKTVLKSTSFYSSPTTPTFCGIREDGIQQIDRLFTSVNRLHLNRTLEFDSASILASILMYSLKTMLELIRHQVFSNAGFNQVQVNVYILYQSFHDYVDQTELFSAMIEELISSAGDRTGAPVPLEVSDLQRIHTEFEKPRQ